MPEWAAPKRFHRSLCGNNKADRWLRLSFPTTLRLDWAVAFGYMRIKRRCKSTRELYMEGLRKIVHTESSPREGPSLLRQLQDMRRRKRRSRDVRE